MQSRAVVDASSLCRQAEQARQHAYAPFSGFCVGAALLARDGRVFVGVNVENPSYGLTTCAERVAIGTAVSAGVRPGDILAVAVASAAPNVTPCGACRQVLVHFCDADARLWGCFLPSFTLQEHRVHNLLPNAFDLRPPSIA